MSERIAHIYYDIKEELINSGFAEEIDWQYDISTRTIDESSFLRETAWVILSSGFYEGTIRKIFPAISDAFFNWSCAKKIFNNSAQCIELAMGHFNNKRKIRSIAKAADIIHSVTLSTIVNDLHAYGPSSLKIFPHIGDITCYHLAKNLGYNTPKPDRHLANISNLFGYDDTFDFCDTLNEITGDPTQEIDIVFWRYANIYPNYLEKLSLHIQ